MPDEGTAPAPMAPQQPNPAEAYQKLLGKHNNDAGDLALKLFGENYDLRESNRDLRSKLPKDGTVQLSAEDAKAYQAYKDLGFEPDAIKAELAKVPELEKTAKELAQMENYREVAAIHGYKVPVLKKLMAEHPDAAFEFKTTKDKDGKETKVALIRTGDKELPFTEFAEKTFADFLPALKQEPDPLPIKNGNTPDPPPAKASDATPADNAAKAAQARYTQSHF